MPRLIMRGSAHLLIVLSALIVLSVLTAVFYQKQIKDKVLAATSTTKQEAQYEGLLLKFPNSAPCIETNGVLCYKMFLNDGQTAIWATRADTAGTSVQAFDSIAIGNKIKTSGVIPVDTLAGKKYYRIKSVTHSPFDFTFGMHLGGGYVDPSYEPDRDDLKASGMSPGLDWKGQDQLPGTTDPYVIVKDTDTGMEECKRKGWLCPIAIGGQPDWAVENFNKAHPLCKLDYIVKPIDPEDEAAFKNFIGAMVKRYPTALAFSLWNEPELPYTPECGYLTPQAYAYQQHMFAQAVHQNGGKVAFTRAWGDKSYGPVSSDDWIKQVLALPEGREFDYMNLHYYQRDQNDPNYTYWAQYDDYAKGGIRGKVEWIRQEMAKYPEGVKPIIFSEIGNKVAQDLQMQQARTVFQLFTQAFSTNLVIDPEWFKLISPHPYVDPGPGFYGLKVNDQKTPSYIAFRLLANKLNGMKFLSIKKNNPNYLEGYTFIDSNLNKKDVLWYFKRPSSLPDTDLTVTYKNVNELTITGVEARPNNPNFGKELRIRVIKDSYDGATDKQITIPVTIEPVIVESSDFKVTEN